MSRLPKHVAIVMDGNGRWAKSRCLPRIVGHKAGVESAKRIVTQSIEKGIKILTLFVFSCENWQRPPEEVDYLMNLFLQTLQQETESWHRNNIQFKVIGDYTFFERELRDQILYSQQLTATNTGLILVIAANYSGRWDITNAARLIGEKISCGKLQVKEINSELFQQYLSLSDLPEPDLFIRTSGEQRISNFMLWQFAYTELYFSSTLWPDFNQKEFEAALAFYTSRERRFGLISEQIQGKSVDA